MLLDRIVATNGIKAPNPPLAMDTFGYFAQIDECYIPFWPNVDCLYHGMNLYRAKLEIQIVLGHAKARPPIPGRDRRKKIEQLKLF